LSKQTAIIFLNSINEVNFVTERRPVSLDERTVSLNILLHFLFSFRHSASKDWTVIKNISRKQKMAFCGKWPRISEVIFGNQRMEQVSKFKYVGFRLSYEGEVNVNHDLEKIIHVRHNETNLKI
jgi:hypothetical protein